jgi:hypothetical protein
MDAVLAGQLTHLIQQSSLGLSSRAGQADSTSQSVAALRSSTYHSSRLWKARLAGAAAWLKDAPSNIALQASAAAQLSRFSYCRSAPPERRR